jgi:hypothetical protein
MLQNPKNQNLITHRPVYPKHQKVGILFTLEFLPNLPQMTYNN